MADFTFDELDRLSPPFAPGVSVLADDGGPVQKKIYISDLGSGGGPSLPQLGAPVASVEAIDDDTLRVSWVSVSGVSSWRVEISSSPSSGFSQVGGVIGAGTLQLDVNGLPSGATRYFRVKAIANPATHIDSNYSAVVNGTTLIGSLPNLSAPTLLAEAIDNDTIRLTIGDVANEVNIRIEISDDGGSSFSLLATVPADTLTYDVNGLAAATTRHFRVRAEANPATHNNSDWSATASATTTGGTEAIDWVDPLAAGSATSDFVEIGGGGVNFLSSNDNVGARGSKKWQANLILEATSKTPFGRSELVRIDLVSVYSTNYNNNDPDYIGILCGFTWYLSDLYTYSPGNAASSAFAVRASGIHADGMRVRIERSGDNALFFTSPDGVTYTLRHTEVGCFAGVTDVFVKVRNIGGVGTGVNPVGFAEVVGQNLITI